VKKLDGPIFRFGEFVLAPQERLLLRGSDPVRLTAKAFDLLVVLVRRAGHLVSKDELLREVWPGTFVQEVSLTVNLSAIRKAMARNSDDPQIIETVSGHGYRFLATVRTVAAGIAWSGDAPSDAYRAYLQGRNALGRRSEDGLKRAANAFEKALTLQPSFAAAHSGLSDCHAALGYLSFMSPADAFPAARQHATSALQLDAALAEAHTSIGFVKMYFDWDWPGAETAFRRAIDLDPDHAPSHQCYSIFLLAADRRDEALEEIKLAQKREPLSPSINTDLGFHFYYTGQYEQALKQLRFAIGLNPDFAPAQLWLGRTWQEIGEFDNAREAFRCVEKELGDWPVSLAARGFVAAVSGQIAEALDILAKLQQQRRHRFVTSYGVALVHAGLRRDDEALHWLDQAFRERSSWLVWLRLDPRWNALRDDRRFIELVDRLGLPGSGIAIRLPAEGSCRLGQRQDHLDG
jgi:DNA-binding winged helix-turn-helix (wHTH) protein/Tfp pilus assembly protein PilF